MAEAYKPLPLATGRDAELLSKAARPHNADQLYGFATECALKAARLEIPDCVSDGALQRKYREHVNELWELIPLQSIQRTAAGLLAFLRSPTKPFANWSVDQRYESGEGIDADVVTKHCQAARRVLGAVGLLGDRSGP